MVFSVWLVCCGLLLCSFILGVCCLLFWGFFVVVGGLGRFWFFNRSNLKSKCQPKHSSRLSFSPLKSQDLPTGEVQILTGPFQLVLNPIFKLPHDTFPSEKVDFGS